MNYSLRPYQLQAKKDTYHAIRSGDKRIINWIATGGGKGLLMADYANDALKIKKKTLVVMRRRDLIFQTRENFKNYRKIDASIIMGKERGYIPNNPIQICSIDTLRNKIKKDDFQCLKEFDLIIIDECHDTTSPTYNKLFDFLGDKIYVGFTATPFAIGNKPLDFWERAIKPIDPHEIRDQGFLSPCKFFRPKKIDTTGIKKINGDYSTKELFEVVTDLKIIGDAIESYKDYGQNKPFIGFCVNINHSKIMAKAFCDAGIPAVHIDQSHNKQERKAVKEGIESGSIKGVFNVNIFSTGWDCPIISVLIGLRPTLSEILAIQQWGRVLRVHPDKKKAIILDHANNTKRFGFPYDSNREACLSHLQLDEKKKQERKDEYTLKAKDCPDCQATIEPYHATCPECGHEFIVKDKEIKAEDGFLVEANQNEKIDRIFIKIQSHYSALLDKEKRNGWKPVAKYFMLHDKFGNDVFKYTKELDIPKWIENAVNKNSQEKKCKNCRRFRKSALRVTNSRFLSYDSKINGYGLGYCSIMKTEVKKDFFCIQFKKRD